MNKELVYIVFGVSGSGKTTIGKALATELDMPFYDADDFHPESNIKKMSDGFPLDDADRAPWLATLSVLVKDAHHTTGCVLACSALKKKYRAILQSIDLNAIRWIFLDGTFDIIAKRMEARAHHFFKKEMLVSQFDALERPETGIVININKSSTAIVKEIMSKLKGTSQLGLLGLGVMGKSLATNFLSRGFSISVYNRQVPGKEDDIAQKFVLAQPESSKIKGFDDLQLFVSSLAQPRTIMIMVNAGKPMDAVITALLPLLANGDCLIDGGNSHYKMTLARYENLKQKGIHFVGAGISGGEEGALKGPSIMPSGSKRGYEQSGIFLEAIAAKDKNNNPCCSYLGPEGSGHYIKMVHNGIEYAEMQLLAEMYHVVRFYAKKTPDQIADIFDAWIKKGLDSYLLEITIAILRKKEGEGFLIDRILDKAGQKGTGGWSTNAALEIGIPLSTISEAIMARNVSGIKTERVKASEIYQFTTSDTLSDEQGFIQSLEKAYQAASIINHHIGFEMLRQASKEYSWNLQLSEIARIWTNGCIIRSNLMEQIWDLFAKDSSTPLLLFPEIVMILKDNLNAFREIVATGLCAGYAVPVFSAAINYFLMYTASQSSANIIQAQRDYFGAHTYQRVDAPLMSYFHTNWKE